MLTSNHSARATRAGAKRVLPLLTALVLMHPGDTRAAPSEQVLWSFGGNASGKSPLGALAAGPNGTLIGTTSGFSQNSPRKPSLSEYGNVFMLSPPSPGKHKNPWSITVLYEFGGSPDGAQPVAGVTVGPGGVLYGTASNSGTETGQGVVFSLSPPTQGQTWIETVLGYTPGQTTAGVLRRADGALFGVSSTGGSNVGVCQQMFGCGTVFELLPPTGAHSNWKYVTLHEFAGGADGSTPTATLISDAAGNLYGVTSAGGPNNVGTVFRLSRPVKGASDWTETVLYAFQGATDGGVPLGQLTFDKAGNLLGTTSQFGSSSCEFNIAGCGVVFALSPSANGAAPWQETVIHSFIGPDGASPVTGLIKNAAGHFFGTTEGGGSVGPGVVFELTPTMSGSWSYSTIYSFSSNDGGDPRANLLNIKGNYYGTTLSGGKTGYGTVFKLRP